MLRKTRSLTKAEADRLFAYDPETGVFTRRVSVGRQLRMKAGARVGWKSGTGYIFLSMSKQERYRAHNVAWVIMTGEWPQGYIVDHKNRDKADNRWCNLRRASNAQNAQNQKLLSTNTTGFKGVSANNNRGKPWKARIRVSGRLIHLGMFDTKEQAAAAYRMAAERYFGEFARVA